MNMHKTSFLRLVLFLLYSPVIFCQQGIIKNKQDTTVLSNNYKLQKASINSTADNVGAFVYKDTLYFSSNKKRRRVIQYLNQDKSYMADIYFTPVNSNQKNKKILTLSGTVNTILNESFPFITKSGTTMYYTANLKHGGRINKNLYILRATKKKGIWTDVENLSINKHNYSNGHPVLNATETVLYFVSDRGSKVGDSDIYAVPLGKDGRFGVAKKLGKNVNTLKKEITPFITKNNELYFSSKGHGGFGGFDVFYIDLNDEKAKAINLGSTINGTADDFYFSMNSTTSKGFLSSTKEGNTNIYHVIQYQPVKELIKKERKKHVDATQSKKYSVTIQNNKICSPFKLGFQAGTRNLNKEGGEFLQYLIDYIKQNPKAIIDVNSFIKINEVSDKLLNERISHVVDKIKNSIKYTYHFKIESKQAKVVTKKKKNTRKEVAFAFDYNSSYLNTISKEKLNEISKQLKSNSTLRIEISTHSDSRGTNTYNMYLSKKRLERIKNYLYSKNIEKQQIRGTAYGEEKNIINCIDCSESDHKENRKVLFRFFKAINIKSIQIKK